MKSELKSFAESKGYKLEVVDIDKVRAIKADLDKFQKETDLNSFQKWILNKHFNFNALPQKMKSVIIMAVPRHASYANITFNRNGKEYKMFGTVSALVDSAERAIFKFVKDAGYDINVERRIPLKRLAVQSGLAEYGRNNLTYVDGIGSYLVYAAFSTDMPCENDNWREMVVSSVCQNCEICLNNCPTQAIVKDRFLLKNNRCLSAWNEGLQDFPEIIPKSAHHTPYDCLKCQVCCPLNAKHQTTVDVDFTEAEVERILVGAPYKDISKEFKNKINLLGLDSWPSVQRNLKYLFDLMDKEHKPTL